MNKSGFNERAEVIEVRLYLEKVLMSVKWYGNKKLS